MSAPAPRWARALLARVVPEERRDDVLGDLEEAHARRRGRHGSASAWLRTSAEALDVAAAFLAYRLRAARAERGVHAAGSRFSLLELRLALRLIRRQPLLAATATLALATGIAVAASGYTLMDSLLWGKVPWAGGDRFVLVSAWAEPEGTRVGLGEDRYRSFLARTELFEHFGALRGARVNLRHAPTELEAIDVTWVSPSLFRAIPVAPAAGRLLVEADAAAGAPRVVVIRESLWERRYGGDPAVVGRVVEMSGEDYTVVGVVPESFRFSSSEAWLPLSHASAEADPAARAFGVLRVGMTPEVAQERLHVPGGTTVASASGEPTDVVVTVRRLHEEILNGPIEAFLVAMVVVLVLVLLVIAANVANLFFARGVARASELAVRTALGASRSRLVTQMGVEVMILGAVAAALGLAVTTTAMGRIQDAMAEVPWLDFSLDPRKLAFLVGATLVAVLVAGVWPAMRVTRQDPALGLRRARSLGGLGMGRAGAATIVLEMALSVALLGSAIVVGRGFQAYAEPRVALPRDRVVGTWVDGRDGPDARTMVEALASIPGVEAAGATTHLPRQEPPRVRVRVEGEAPVSGPPETARVVGVLPGFFDVLGARPSAGRLLRDEDLEPGALPAAVADEPFAHAFFGEGNALGRTVVVDERRVQIVGVVPDLGMTLGEASSAGGLYVPLASEVFQLLVRAPEPWRLDGRIRGALADVDETLAPGDLVPLERAAEENVAFLRGVSLVLLGVGGVALLLSLVGMYALMSYAVTRRTPEIGVRVALGAERGQVLMGVVGGAARQMAVGAVLGTGLGLLLLRGDALFTFDLPRAGALTFPAVVALMLLAGGAAAWVPARRALRIRPVDALKGE